MIRHANAKVVTIDDSERTCDVPVMWLTSSGYPAITTPAEDRALPLIDEEQPDLVLLDVMMVELNGLEVCRRLKQHAATRGVAVVVVSGLHHPENVRRAFELGALRYLTRPV